MSSFALYFMLTTFALARGNLQQPSIEKIDITVYYEVLCYHSVKLIQAQLYPTWTELRDYMNITLVPFGKAAHNKNKNGTWEFQCHHGEEECYGNKIQACALNEFKNDTSLSLEYVRCSVNFNSNYPFNTTCFEDVNKDVESKKRFEECISGPKGDDLLAKYGDMTPSLSYVPTLYFNGAYDNDLDRRARRNLKQTVCQLIKSAKPSACKE